MAKITFTKLKLTSKKDDVKILQWGDNEIEVKQYLPIQNKLEVISNVINKSADENNFANPVKLEVFLVLEMIYAYTNISFTEKQKEDFVKLYDLIVANGLFDAIKDYIPEKEWASLRKDVYECAEAIYNYRNSLLGILEAIGQNYENMDLDATEIHKKLSDPNNMTLLKEVLTKLG